MMNEIEPDTITNPTLHSKCELCAYYLGNRSCPAFDKIPNEIWKGKHDKVVEGQDVDIIFLDAGKQVL